MGWLIAQSKSYGRHFDLESGVDPINILPIRPRGSGDRQSKDKDDRDSVIVPGSPEDPCREAHWTLARAVETLLCFPEAFAAYRRAIMETEKPWR